MSGMSGSNSYVVTSVHMDSTICHEDIPITFSGTTRIRRACMLFFFVDAIIVSNAICDDIV